MGLSVLRRVICPEAGLSVSRRVCLSRGGPVCAEVGLSVSRRDCLSRGGLVCLEAGLSIPRSENMEEEEEEEDHKEALQGYFTRRKHSPPTNLQ